MDEAHKELVSVLRKRAELAAQEGNMTATCDARYFAQSADALETMAGEVARLASALEGADQEVQERLLSTEAERDCLKAALETIAEEHDAGRHDGLPEPCPAHDADTMFYVARKALGDAS